MRRLNGKFFAVCLILGFLVGCSETAGDDPNVQCERITIDSADYCTYGQPITETGYDCPPDLPNSIPMGPGTVCAGPGGGPGGPGGGAEVPDDHEDQLLDQINDSSQPGDPGQPNQPNQPTNQTGVDILWVIDNSGSMCEEQSALRQNFDKFISKVIDQDIDFHIGVTTTHMDSYPLEPVAKPAQLQSTPQPLPSPLPICHGDEGDPNAPMDGFGPIRQAIDQAIACTEQPSQWAHLVNVTDTDIACELRSANATNCDCATDVGEVDANTPLCSRENLFPTYQGDVSPYRNIPKVLRASDYRNMQTGQFDAAAREQLHDDFACMSFVGTSGNSIEKGLEAAVEAVSPQMTGGTVEKPTDTSAPNHGLLREDAKFSVIFMTDENDCSHGDAELDKRTGCGAGICTIANHPDWQGTPLTPSTDLAQDLKANLTGSKGYQVNDDAIIAASIHGRAKRYGDMEAYPADQPPLTVAECEALTPPISNSIAQQSSCDTPDFGTAYSGDRYESFLREFDPDQIFPAMPSSPSSQMDGLICDPTVFGNTLEQIGQTLADSLP